MTSLLRRTLCAAPLASVLTLLPAAAQAQTSVAPKEETQAPAPATPVANSYPSAAAGDGATSAGYNLSRWAEDWRGMCDPAKRDDPIDRLKCLPLDSDGDVYLTLSGELRLRVNETTNPNLRESGAQRQDINRIVAGADLHVGPHFRAFGEIAHGGLAGRNLGTIAGTMRNDLVVQQAFVEGDATVAGADVGVRYGRQEFTDGPNLLTSQRDNNTIRFVLNGTRAWVRGKGVRADVFDYKLTSLGTEGTDDDRVDDGRRFSGATFGVVLPPVVDGAKLYFDPFFWRLRNDTASWGGVTAREVRHYQGAHLWGDAGPLTLDWTVNHQGGSFGNRDIDAWQVLLAQTYRIGGKDGPRVGFHFDYASGGGAYDEGKLSNSLAPFGNNVYYSYQLALTPTNLVALAPNVTFAPVKKLRLTAEYQLSWRDSASDAVYRANGTAFSGTEVVGGHKIGDVARLQAIYTVSPRVSLTGRYEHLSAGPVLTRAGYTDSDFLAGWISFRF
ncbi:alginate export family protein [Sphingomonas sp. PL-96]|uniref:alginate export family protein n=1 Tax=Sphingomonas sp. PL-96 TaxID=2887201 RepID=UPI001E4E4B3D|nr:alginate export family protein [Sphingomonas sp. PL-96]MCC2976083.1 alginate export family protein [Sphingomonas sp. PL-96]